MKKLFVLCSFFSLLSFSSMAQKFEIRSSYIDESNVSIEVRVLGQPAPKTSDFLTDFVFGVKWDSEQDLDIESVTNVGGFNITKSDVETLDGQFEYQAFFANATPFLFPVDWRHKEWIEVVRIKFTGVSLNDQMIKIAEPNFNDNTNPNFGLNLKDHNLSINGFSSSDEHYISLAEFQAKSKNNDVQLSWISEIEINTEHFVVEKSHNASHWTDLGTVEAQINSNMPSDYSFLDENAFVASKSGVVIYYRLKMVKKDGSYEYSKTQVVQQEPHYFEFAVQPTSSSSQSLNIIRSNSEESSEVYIYNYSGMLIQKSTLGSQQQIFQLNDIPSGVYFVRIGDQARKVFIP